MHDREGPDERRRISWSGGLTNGCYGCLTALVMIVAGLILLFPAIC